MITVATATLISVLTSLALQALSIGIPEWINSAGNKIDKDLTNAVKDLASKLQNNESLIEDLTHAYNTKSTQVMNEIFRSIGFGNRFEALQKEYQNMNTSYLNKLKEMRKQSTDYQNQINRLNEAKAETGYTISGNSAGKEALSQYENGGLK